MLFNNQQAYNQNIFCSAKAQFLVDGEPHRATLGPAGSNWSSRHFKSVWCDFFSLKVETGRFGKREGRIIIRNESIW